VTTTSECSRRDVHQLLGVPLERIVVAPCAVDPVFRAPRSPAATARPYLLTLGNDKPHKDMTPALDALEALAGRHDMDLVLVGALSPRLRRRVVSSAWRPRIRAESYVTDERLAELYAGAAVFVFPSRFEGFGLPPLEAMACGAPVAAFDTPAVAETCGDAARLVPVGDAAALTQAVADLLENPQARRDLIEAGRRRAAGFSWSETARRMLDVYRRALA
jgi:glycosyltransferase involved in cell wall biosynthesis